MSYVKGLSVGGARAKIRALKDASDVMYIARVKNHVLLLNRDGETIIDTDPRKVDKRPLVGLVAVFKNLGGR